MKKTIASVALCLAIGTGSLLAQSDYSDHKKLSDRVSKIGSNYSSLAKTRSLTKTTGGKDIWMITIGTGDVTKKPALAIVGGVDGSHLLGSELAIGFAEKLLAQSKEENIKSLLEKHTFYIFPDMSPDASAQYFAALKYERKGNATNTDDDRDGRMNEDPFEDLNKDGLITMVRIESPTGEWKTHPDDERVMVKADLKKGEKGNYILITEGIDNDKDGKFNEDGPGGIDFNKSLTYQFPNFTPGAGEYPVSEPENRALLDFLMEAYNIYGVVVFGPDDNLNEPFKYNASAASKRVLTTLLEKDVKANEMVSDKYKSISKAKDAPKSSIGGGSFLNWAYFHYGRYSYGTPGWWAPKVTLAEDSLFKDKKRDLDQEDVRFLRWAKSQGIDNAFVDWTSIQHPDFQGMKAEVGGIRPFIKTNPPYVQVDSITKVHTDFVLALAEMAPQIQIINTKTEEVGKGLTRVSVTIYNSGLFATQSELGERVRWIQKLKVSATPAKGQKLISGDAIQLLEAIPGDGSVALTWLVQGSGKFTIEAGSPNTGIQKTELNIK